VRWIKEYIFFHHRRHPAEMGKQEVSRFLSHLAVKRNVTASTQNQALRRPVVPLSGGPQPAAGLA
jgi:hypothetical protein